MVTVIFIGESSMSRGKPGMCVSALENLEEGVRGFRASLMSGPDIDLFALAGFAARDDVESAVWEETNWKGLVEDCFSATLIEVGDCDEAPGQSDVFYEVRIDDELAFAAELRALMLAFLERAQRGAS